MTDISRQEAWQRLLRHSLVEGDLLPTPAPRAPWFVRVMLGVAGWIGALFLLGFVGAAFAFVMKSAAASFVLGALCCGGAYAVFRTAPERDFATQFGLAVSLAGQAMIATGVFKALDLDKAPAYLIICAIEALLAGLMPNFIHRLISAWAALAALWFGLAQLGIYGVAPAMAAAACAAIWSSEARWADNPEVWRPLGYGAALALLQIDAWSLFDSHAMPRAAASASWLAAHAAAVNAVLIGAVLSWTVWRLLADQRVSPSGRAGMSAIAAALLLAAVSSAAPGIASAALILLLGFARGNRLLIGLGLCALGGFLSHYYYQMQTTLLVKSAVLAATGFALLVARAAMRKWFGANGAEGTNA
ncbi:MAG TPA: DUF4401 domain-containing protein [Paucimonas sp.]|nr:DUF4401 domain-containing protein [Paucimonas sp.]